MCFEKEQRMKKKNLDISGKSRLDGEKEKKTEEKKKMFKERMMTW